MSEKNSLDAISFEDAFDKIHMGWCFDDESEWAFWRQISPEKICNTIDFYCIKGFWFGENFNAKLDVQDVQSVYSWAFSPLIRKKRYFVHKVIGQYIDYIVDMRKSEPYGTSSLSYFLRHYEEIMERQREA